MEITIDAIAHGGDGIGRVDGKAHFVAATMPSERARVEIIDDRGNFARARLIEILDASADRTEPPCPFFGACGGCTWQFAAYEAQLAWKTETVRGQLSHLGRISSPDVRPALAPSDPYAYRNRMDFRVLGRTPALARSRSKELVSIEDCLLIHPALRDLFDRLGPLDGVDAITIRAGVRTGDRLALIDGEIPDQAGSWGANIARRDGDEIVAIAGPPSISEEVAGVRFRVSASAFFQVNTDGAETLVALVSEALEPTPDDTMLDGFAGGGLFSATVGAAAGRVLAVESAAASIADARRNLRAALPERNRIVAGRFENVVEGLDEYWAVAVVNPPRSGLGPEGVSAVTAAEPRAIAYVSCDPASLARDARMLNDAGYGLDWAAPVDLFPQTYHIETVARFERASG